MKYQNPVIPEGINTSQGHPLQRFATLFGGLLMLVIVAVFSLRLMAGWIASQVPFAYEQQLAERFLPGHEDDGSHARLLSYLQWLAQRLTKAVKLPEGMTVTIHYRDEPSVNAVATLGGHIIIYRGLLERLESENALAMVMAHEIAHVKRRHPLIALGNGAVFGLAVAAITGSTGDVLAGRILGQLGMVAGLRFSREQERQADADALHAVYRLYGHVSGADGFYNSLLEADDRGSGHFPEFMQTHPAVKNRINQLQKMVLEQGWPTNEPILTLPDFKLN